MLHRLILRLLLFLCDFASIVCNNFFEEEGGDYKFVKILEDTTGIDIRNDINIFCNGYKGNGFYDTVYGEKMKLPFWFWGLSIGLILVGLGISLFAYKYGKTSWKWAIIGIWMALAIIGVIILASFFMGKTWQMVSVAIRVPTAVGLLTVSETDIAFYDKNVQEVTNEFLETGVLRYDDASGLSYVDRYGNQKDGTLAKAETGGLILYSILIGLYILLNLWLVKRTFFPKKKGLI